MRKDNKGFSLVELIIVIAIMAAITGVMGYGLSLSSGKAADECAQKLTSSIQRTRTSTMGKFKTTIMISKDENGVWAQETITMANQDTGGEGTETNGDLVKVGDKNVKVELRVGTSSGYVDLSKVSFLFDRGSGALKSYKIGESDWVNCDSVDKIYFRISRASKIRYIEIVPLTGKVAVKDTDA